MRENPNDAIWRVAISKYLLVLTLILGLVLSFVTLSQAKKHDQEPPGTILIEIFWGDDVNADVDLWVEGPTGGPVGYSRRSNALFNLLRDDLGRHNDLSGKNYENVYSRGIAPGAYVVNAMLYSGAAPSVDVTVVVSVRNPTGNATTQIGRWDHTIARTGDEDTVVRFSLTKDGALVPGSVNSVPKGIRNP